MKFEVYRRRTLGSEDEIIYEDTDCPKRFQIIVDSAGVSISGHSGNIACFEDVLIFTKALEDAWKLHASKLETKDRRIVYQ